jgi:6-pyruvoyl-tetrahydropterin synthase
LTYQNQSAMPHTEYFFVSAKDNKVRKTTEATCEYFIPNGKKEGQAKYIIEVFGYRHEETAKEVRDKVDKAEMGNKLYTIKVENR